MSKFRTPRLGCPPLQLVLGTILVMFVAGSPRVAAETGKGALSGTSAPAGQQSGPGPPGMGVEQEPGAGLLPTTNYLRVAGSVLRPRNSGLSYTAAGGGGCVYVTGGSSSVVWNTPVYLPQGTTVNFLRLYYDDTSASNMIAWFTVYDLYGGIVQEWNVSSTGSGGNGFATSALIDHQIDYGANSYVLNWRPNDSGSDTQLCGFNIFYFDPNIFSDGFESGNTDAWSAAIP